MWTACKQFVCSRIKFVLKMHFKCIATKMLPGFHEYHAKIVVLLTSLNLLSLAVKTQTSLVFTRLLAALFFCPKKEIDTSTALSMTISRMKSQKRNR